MSRNGLKMTLGAAFLGVGIVSGCGGEPGSAREVLAPFMDAVQERDADRLFCLMAGVADAGELGNDLPRRREAFDEWLDEEYRAYEKGRDAGQVDLNGHGVQLVKLFALGRGTYYDFGPPERVSGPGQALRTELRFGYGQLDLSRLSPGTTFYLAAQPAGKVHAVRMPSGPVEIELEVLSGIDVRWTLLATDPREGCANRWAVVSAEPVDGTATSARYHWVF